MKAKSIFILAISSCIISFAYWFFKNNQLNNIESAPFIKPPLKGVNVKYSTYVITPSKDTLISCGSGSKIKIPANAFLDNKGNVINEPITIRYREFNDAIDIFLSGIPMTYDSSGNQYQFESAGMFEILAFKNDEPVFTNSSSPIIVEMISDQTENRFNKYFLDTISKNWQYIAESDKASDANSNEDVLTHVLNSKTIDGLPTEPVKAYSKNVFDIDFDKNEFPELAGYEGVKFEVTAEEKNYDANLSTKTWESVKIEKHSEDLTYIVTFIGNNETHSFKVKPVYEGTDYANAKKKYELLLANYNSKLNQKTEVEKKLQKATDSIYAAQRKVVEIANTYSSVSAYEQVERAKTEGVIMCVFTISRFGIWNSDCPINFPIGKPMLATFKDRHRNKLEFDHVYLIEKGKRAIFNYYSDRFNKFQYNTNAKNTLIAVTKDNQLAIFRSNDFEKLKSTKPKPDNDTLSYISADTIRFIMKIHLIPIKNAEVLKSLINI